MLSIRSDVQEMIDLYFFTVFPATRHNLLMPTYGPCKPCSISFTYRWDIRIIPKVLKSHLLRLPWVPVLLKNISLWINIRMDRITEHHWTHRN